MVILSFVGAVGLAQMPFGATGNSADFTKAAKTNSILKNTLRWKWGKQQKGWYLYVPLLQKTLATEAGPDSAEFAEKVAGYQRIKGLRRSGVLNQTTLFSIIKHWQSKRIRPIYEAKESALLTAPITNFYDPTRDLELLKVDRTAFDAYKRMIDDADKALNEKNGESGPYLSIISSYRSPAYQASLRKKDPKANRAQLAYRSPHFTGRALDIYVGGEPVTTKDENRAIQVKTQAYLWLVENADKYGFQPYFYEPWHWEYVAP